MSNGNSGDGRLSKNERREAAREKARVQRDGQKKKDRRTKLFLQSGVGLALVAIVAVIALVLVNSNQPAGPGPQNFASDGVQLKQGFIATPTEALEADDEPIASVPDEGSGVLDIQLYVDYLCPICGDFEATTLSTSRASSTTALQRSKCTPSPFLIVSRRASGTPRVQ